MNLFDIFRKHGYFDPRPYDVEERPLYKNTARNKRESQKKRHKRRKRGKGIR